ncbi:MAG TPA: hypothetical protein VII13_14160 [Vicinamibacteria bacterium]|jgi:hypothetical protein
MTIFGKSLADYCRFAAPFLAAITVVGLLRLGLSLAGVSPGVARWFSMTVVWLVALLVLSARVHTTGFGSFKQLLGVMLVITFTAHAISALGVAIAIATGTDNVFSVPEYSGGQDGKTVFHLLAHLIGGLTVFPLVAWLVGSLVLLVTRKVAPGGSATPRAA